MKRTAFAFALVAFVAAIPARAQKLTPADPNAKGEEIWVETSEASEQPGKPGEPIQIHIDQPRTEDPDPEPPTLPHDAREQDAPPPAAQPIVPQAADQPPAGPPSPADAVTSDMFNKAVAGYGKWVIVKGIGYVWQPNYGLDNYEFKPYASDGHWSMTEYGWTWVSNYAWGWAAFHYGRWWLDPEYGWVWSPGFVWGPAWVSWRYGDGNYGWLPDAPPGFAYGRDWLTRAWTFVDGSHFAAPHVREYVVRGARTSYAYGASADQKGSDWSHGPPMNMISHAQQSPVHIETLARSGAVAHHPALTSAFRTPARQQASQPLIISPAPDRSQPPAVPDASKSTKEN